MLDQVSDGSRQHFLVVSFSLLLGFIAFQRLSRLITVVVAHLDTLLLEPIGQAA